MATGGADDAKTEVHKDATTMTQLEEDAKVNMSKFKLLPHVDGENGPVVSTPNFDARFNFNPTGPNESYLHGMPATYSIPKLPTFSGNESSQKGEVTYDVWSFEVRCLKRTGQYPEHIILQALRNSLKGTARSMLVSLGEGASVNDVLTKLDGFYGTVSTCEILMQSFYNDYQKENESIVSFASRIEETLIKAINRGHLDISAKDSMLRSKFWTGLKSQELRNSTRHHYDSKKDFQSLLMEIRKVEQEETNKVHMVQKVNSKVARQQPSQVDTQRDSNKEVLDQLTKLMSRLESLEQKVNTNIVPPHTGDSRPTYRGRGQTYNRYSNRGNRTPFRGRASGRGKAPNFRYNGSQSSN
ncbi:hypothetical protein FSP39_017390 [Pinctada imbricata]|uniref:Paraneoplastic antigen Ma-like C-terminal domain-containing protein n=1 Tax=Pinctada imbricata TaxID=66713 RepID=A0AA88XPW5_PINIB|nr:hypothetical protein FSP39_017390 [Pinctada imbricata]